jgi:catechol 2,3-dioxygenase-like lactoylglutathione lyase family enzyme
MRPAGILETVLYVDDLDAAADFYGRVLGLDLVSRVVGRQVFFRCGTQMLLLFEPNATARPAAPGALPVPTHGAKGPGHVCFRASGEEIERWRKHLADAGVTIEADFEWPAGGRSIYFRDPAGNSLEIAEPRIWRLT